MVKGFFLYLEADMKNFRKSFHVQTAIEDIWIRTLNDVFLCFGKVKTGDLASDLDFPLCHLIPVVCYGAVIKKWQEITTG